MDDLFAFVKTKQDVDEHKSQLPKETEFKLVEHEWNPSRCISVPGSVFGVCLFFFVVFSYILFSFFDYLVFPESWTQPLYLCAALRLWAQF